MSRPDPKLLQSTAKNPATRASSRSSDLAGPPVEWLSSPPDEPVDYQRAVALMEHRIAAIRDGAAPEAIWLLEHPPLYTAGTSAKPEDLLSRDRFPVYATGRGGQYTYHGPGQLVVYVMLDVKARFGDVRAFVTALENWLLETLARDFDISARTHRDRVGVWVPIDANGRHHGPSAATSHAPHVSEAKIAAIGIRLRRWVSMHGLSLNIAPDLTHFDGIVPCGISEFGTTSLAVLGRDARRGTVEDALRRAFEDCFAPTCDADASHFMKQMIGAD